MDQELLREAILSELESAEVDAVDLIVVLLQEISDEIHMGVSPEDLVEGYIGKVVEE